jgi:hypothetical protein
MSAIRSMTVIALLVAAAVQAGPAEAQEAPRQRVSDTFTTTEPGASAGRRFEVDFTNPADPQAKPPAVSKVELALHPGSRFDTAAIPRCAAGDAELQIAGEGACPQGSRLGQNVVVVDTGFTGPGRFVTTDFTFFNAKDELILLGTERGSGARLVLRGRIRENTLTIDLPPLPGTPPDGGADKSERATFLAASSVRDGRAVHYLTTPPTCPAGGRWTNRVTYTYRDGVRQTATTESPCVARRNARRGDHKRPRVRVAGVPRRRCAARAFRARVRIAERWSGLRRARVALDGRTLRRVRARKRFAVRVRRLAPGRHRLTATAVDRAGNRGSRTVKFRFCRRRSG